VLKARASCSPAPMNASTANKMTSASTVTGVPGFRFADVFAGAHLRCALS
jgi:hypothetical protein